MPYPMNLRVAATSLVALSLLGATIAFGAAAPAKGDAAKGDAAKGKAIFSVKCIACHKADGSGGVKLTGNPTPNWKDPKTWADPKRKNVDAYLRDCITNGKLPSGMVAWGKTGQLKPVDIDNVIAYIHVLAKR